MDLLAHDSAADDRAANLAWEEALVRAGPPRPLLRLWQNAGCVVLGRAQRAEREVNLSACADGGIPVLRRASGGGTVFQDLGNLNISLAVPGSVPGVGSAVKALVAAVLGSLGLEATTAQRGLYVGPAKVSGIASQVTRSGSLAHATLLVTTPAARVWAFLAPPPAVGHPTDSRRSPVAPLLDLGCDLGLAEITAAVAAQAALRHGRLSPRPPTDGECRWQERLLAQRYRIDSWNLTGHTKEAQWTTRPGLICTG